MALPLHSQFAASLLALALTAVPATSQHRGHPPSDSGKRAPPSRSLGAPSSTPVGLRIYTSDGKAIGRVIATGLDEADEQVLVGEVERSLGLGPRAIAIPTDMFTRKGDRIELTITAAEVNAKLGRQ